MNTKTWLMALVMATACGSTASSSDTGTADADDASDAECDPNNFDSFDDNCPCNSMWANHVCVGGKIVCPPCSGADVSSQDVAKGTDVDTAPDVTLADTTGTDAAITDSQPDAAPDVPTAHFSAVQAVFDARCTNCHSATALGLPGYAALPLTSDVSYKNLVNQPAHETCGNILVAPGKPKESYLWQKLTVDAPCSGSHMPAKFEILPAAPLTAEQLAAIQDWIAAGAQP